jgi:hypothetical protein
MAITTLHPQLLQLAPLFDCIDDVLAWVKDRAGRYRWVNHAFLLNYAFNERRDTSGPASTRFSEKPTTSYRPRSLPTCSAWMTSM